MLEKKEKNIRYAVALLGAVRGTIYIDFIVEWTLTTLKKVEQSLIEIGLQPQHLYPLSTHLLDKD